MKRNFSQYYSALINEAVPREFLPTEDQADTSHSINTADLPTPDDGFIATYCSTLSREE